MKWQPIETAPKDGTWILLRGRNSVGHPMIPVVVSWTSGEGLTGLRKTWRDSAGNRDMERLVFDVPPGHTADWMPLPSLPPGLHSDEEPALAGDTVGAADAVASLTQKIEAQSAIISEKNDLIDKLEAERETLITELERLLKQLGRKDLSI